VRAAENLFSAPCVCVIVCGERNAAVALVILHQKLSPSALYKLGNHPRGHVIILYDIKRKGPSINVGYANSVITPAGPGGVLAASN
jgi:hypothetical protein